VFGVSPGSQYLRRKSLLLKESAVALVMVLTSSICAGTLSAAASTLKAPVISEAFSSATCPTTTSGKDSAQGALACARDETLNEDKRINALNKQIFALLPTKLDRELWITANDEWYSYRQSDCAAQQAPYESSKSLNDVVYACYASVDATRVSELATFYKSFSTSK